MIRLVLLLINFCRIGLFSIGGGLATLPFIFELADHAGTSWIFEGWDWLNREMVGNVLAIAQSLPGPGGINFGAYLGFHYGVANGFNPVLGASLCAVGLVIPCVIIICIIARAMKAFQESPIVKSLFQGFRPAAAGLLSSAGLGAIMVSLWNRNAAVWYGYVNWLPLGIFIVLFVLIHRIKLHPIVFIAAAGVLGVVLGL
jgi:chromate transporter